jgi:hypothetical protein
MPLSPDAPDSWPASLPQAPKYGMQEQRQRNVIAFQGDTGQPKQRRRSTATAVVTTAVFEMTDTQLVDFNTFYEQVLKDGTIAFTWAHPRTGITYNWCFASDEAPVVEATTINFNTVSCKLLRLP